MKTNNIGDWVNHTITAIHGKTEFPQIEVYAIAANIMGKSREYLFAHPEFEIAELQQQEMNEAVSRLVAGEPLAYITGKRSFYGLELYVNRNVLVPRPETEILVEEVIAWLENHPGRRSMVDIGTGSGAIAIACADRFSDLAVTAIDLSIEALSVASRNSEKINVIDRIKFIQNDLLENITEKFDLIAANLPYIPSDTLDELDVVRFEPRLALDGGREGMVFIHKLLEQMHKNLLAGGCAFFEIQYNQLILIDKVKSLYPNAIVTVISDLASLPRVIKIQF